VFASPWGFFAHKTINELAVYCLPPEMHSFYRANISTLIRLSVNPDMRRYVSESEAPKHYLDADHYEDCYPLDTIIRNYKQATEAYSLDTMKKYGMVPWNLQFVVYRLTESFMNNDLENVIKISADLGHYAGDLNVPLHATQNYNGQLTGQHGIHGLWESRLPELFFETYRLNLARTHYISNINHAIWDSFEESFRLKDSVLQLELKTRDKIGISSMYAIENRGNQTVRSYSVSFCDAYQKQLNRMVERRLVASIELTSSLWYTAWVNAGQPILPDSLVEIGHHKTIADSVTPGKIKGRFESH
jgi:hypothetical protein